jgi:hypothetical protein
MRKHVRIAFQGRRRGQAGFALVVVFMLLVMMAAAAMAVLLGARTDIRVGGHERENAVAFYSAEAGLAYGKGWLVPQWNTATYWTAVLQNPQATTGITQDYRFGGSQGVPLIRSEYTYRFRNNPDDPSGSPTVDQDGRIILISVGRAYDPAGSRVLATVTLQMEVQWKTSQAGAGDYQAQPNQDVTGAAKGHADTQAVDMTGGTTL